MIRTLQQLLLTDNIYLTVITMLFILTGLRIIGTILIELLDELTTTWLAYVNRGRYPAKYESEELKTLDDENN